MNEAPAPATGLVHWHALSSQQALDRLISTRDGLSDEEAERRQATFGPNSLPTVKPVHPVLRFLGQFNNTLIYFLFAASITAFFLGQQVDAAVILAVVLVNGIVGFVQEGRAEKSLSGIGLLLSSCATVLRNGETRTLDVAALVPGDIVLLDAGDRVPADLRLVRSRSLAIEEAALTGESIAADKQDAPVADAAALGDRTNMAFSGTFVARGQGSGLVVATGTSTEIGKISGMVQQVMPLVTPLLRQIDAFAHWLSITIIVFGAALFAFAVLVRDFAWSPALMAIVAVAVGAIPESLPAVITVTMAIGVQRMAARRAVIRKLPAVESLGATSVICTDKTGTLTRNEMTVVRLFTPDREFAVGGIGYGPQGEIRAVAAAGPAPDSVTDPVTDSVAVADETEPLIRCGLLCNDARLVEEDDGWRVAGDPMEGALIALAMKARLPVAALRAGWTRLDEIPFDTTYGYMATLNAGPDGQHVIFIKGAPEVVVALCGGSDAGRWQAAIERAASQGQRLLGFAMRTVPSARRRIDHEDLAGATMLGLMAFVDPPREEAKRAIAQCRTAGIEIKMITGDHAATAVAIARKLELAVHPKALSGPQIEAMDDAELARQVPGISVFARASPEHKLRIVRALQSHGHIVAMTGDGVNDAPSLKQADVGTAMGASGTEAAREAAEMVLLDDNFASIVAAAHEGRTVHDNIRKVIAWTLPTNGGEAIVTVTAIVAGLALPMTATQILWINLVTAVTFGLVLAFEPSEPGVMKRPPRRREAPLLSGFLLWRVVLVSLLFAAVSLGVFFGSQQLGASLDKARTMVVNMIVVAEAFYLFNVRFLHLRSLTWTGTLGTRPVLIALGVVALAQAAFTYFPPLQAVFETEPLALAEVAVILALGVALFLLLEVEKVLTRRWNS